jgi:hypothetical protein
MIILKSFKPYPVFSINDRKVYILLNQYLSAEVKNGVAIHPLPLMPSWRGT